jgi:hypothetical protein
MGIFRLPYILLVTGFLVIAFCAGAVQILQIDWSSNHKALNTTIGTVDWLEYKFRRAISHVKHQFVSNDKIGLPQVRIYVSEQNLEALMDNPPESTKIYRKAFMLYPDGSIQRIKIRYRGDNPLNWLFEKKSLRIKARKKKLFNGRRVLNLNVPQSPSLIELYIAYNAAKDAGVLSPGARLVEVFINDQSYGVLIEYDQPGEVFLRHAGQMPVNLYKGEQAHIERSESIDLDLYDNPSLWAKVAVGNDLPEDDDSDLKYVLDLIRKSVNNDQAFEQLKLVAPLSVWARFAAYQTLTQNAHNTGYHNQRLMIDPWRGEAHPVLNDPQFLLMDFGVNELGFKGLAGRHFREIKEHLPANMRDELEIDTQSLLRVFNRNSEFIYSKYKFLHAFLKKDKILEKAEKRAREILKPLLISAARDQDLWVREETWAGFPFSGPADKLRHRLDQFTTATKSLEAWLTKQLYTSPSAIWQNSNGNFQLGIEQYTPMDGLTLVRAKGSKVPSKIAWDTNNNGKLDSSDFQIPMNIIDGRIKLKATWLANRTAIDSGLYRHSTDYPRVNYLPRATKFNLVADVPLKIENAIGRNPFSRNLVIMDNHRVDGAWPSRRNKPVINHISPPIQIWRGEKRIQGTHYIDAPVHIEPGTKILMGPGANIVFRGRIQISGSASNPVIITPLEKGKPFGLIALQGPNTTNSVLQNLHMDNGSGGRLLNVQYTAMLNIHNSENIELDSIKLRNNHKFDDMVHIVYTNNVRIKNMELRNAKMDAIDIDISNNVRITQGKIIAAGNDGIDLMSSNVAIDHMVIAGNKDKGISVGENSVARVTNTLLRNNLIGIESKDGSVVQVSKTSFDSNKKQLNAYLKNWRYGTGGKIEVKNSHFAFKEIKNAISAAKDSAIQITNSSMDSVTKPSKRVTFEKISVTTEPVGFHQ